VVAYSFGVSEVRFGYRISLGGGVPTLLHIRRDFMQLEHVGGRGTCVAMGTVLHPSQHVGFGVTAVLGIRGSEVIRLGALGLRAQDAVRVRPSDDSYRADRASCYRSSPFNSTTGWSCFHF